MLLVVGKSTHPPRRDVEHVAWLLGAVGKAPGEVPLAVHKHQPPTGRRLPQELNGEQRAACTPPDDGDVEGETRRHISTSQPSASGSPRPVSSVIARKARSATSPRCSLSFSERLPQVSSLT